MISIRKTLNPESDIYSKLQIDMSNFSSALTEIFDAGLLNRKQWSEVLDVDELMLLAWAQDEAMPIAKYLRAILDVAERDERFQPALAKLNTVLDTPIPKCKTLRHYLIIDLKNSFLESLDTLSPEVQERILFEASRLIREHRANDF